MRSWTVCLAFCLPLLLMTPLAFPKDSSHAKPDFNPVLSGRKQEQELPKAALYKLNCALGFNVLSGSAIVSGFQLGRRIYSKFPIYTGPEVNFMLFSPGSSVNVLWGAWLEHHPFSNPQHSLDLGLGLGASFSNLQPTWSPTSVALFFDGTYSSYWDETLTLRGQIRPGVISGHLVLMFNFNAQFGFL